MQIGLATLIGVEPIPFPDLVHWCGANGIYALEVNVGPGYPKIGGAPYGGHLDLDRIVTEGAGYVEEALGDSGVEIVSLAPMINLLSGDLDLRATRIDLMRQTIDAARILGVETVVTFAGSAFGMHFSGLPGVGGRHSSNHIADNLEIFRKVYGPIADYAESKGIRIAFETAGRGGPEGNIAHSPFMWERMFDTVPSTALGLSFDPSHLVWLHIPNQGDIVREFGDRIYHVDGKDCEVMPARLARQGILGNDWWRYRLPGLGSVPWAEVFSALRDVGYDGIVAIENEDPLCPGLSGVRWAADYLNRLVLPDPGTTVVEPIRPTADDAKGDQTR